MYFTLANKSMSIRRLKNVLRGHCSTAHPFMIETFNICVWDTDSSKSTKGICGRQYWSKKYSQLHVFIDVWEIFIVMWCALSAQVQQPSRFAKRKDEKVYPQKCWIKITSLVTVGGGFMYVCLCVFILFVKPSQFNLTEIQEDGEIVS